METIDIYRKMWNEAFEAGRKVQEKVGGKLVADVFYEWQRIAKNYSTRPNCFQWNQKMVDIIPKEDIEKLSNMCCEHFLRQILRIPIQCKPTQVRIMQIAYNFGQLIGSGALDDDTSDGTMLSDYKPITRYIDVEYWIELKEN